MTNEWVNSYKRAGPWLRGPGLQSPWSRRTVPAMVRVPLDKLGQADATVELRNPDPACNPDSAFAAMLAAGLDGIEKGMELPPRRATTSTT